MKTIYTTKNANVVVEIETGRQRTADGEFFAILEGREPKMIDLPDAYHVRPVSKTGQRTAYHITECLEDAIETAEKLSGDSAMTTHTISVAVNNEEAAEFAAWLRAQGHDASVGDNTGNYIDCASTSCNKEARTIMGRLWADYCNSY